MQYRLFAIPSVGLRVKIHVELLWDRYRDSISDSDPDENQNGYDYFGSGIAGVRYR